MSGNASELAQQFFLTGAQTYLDAQDAITEFERLVTNRCRVVAKKRLPDIVNVCGAGFCHSEKLSDFNKNFVAAEDRSRRIGARLAKDRCHLLFCFEFRRDNVTVPGNPPGGHGIVVHKALVYLWRKNKDAANDLWLRRPAAISGAKAKDDRRLYFGPLLPETQIPAFDEHLNQAVSDFVSFVEEAGGLQPYFP